MDNHDEEDFFLKDRKEDRAERKRISQKDRSKFKKTDLSKRKKILQELNDEKLSKKTLSRGRVLSILPEGISVQTEDSVILCVLAGALKKEKSHAKNLVTVGDFVLYEADKALILQVEERRSLLARTEHLSGKKEQALAANIDQVLITVSVVAPGLKSALVDRYIIATRKGNMEPVIVINKIDLLQEGSDEFNYLISFMKTYQDLGLTVIALSAQSGEGIDRLKATMKDRASVFSGQSGVGKSSLINAMTGLDLATGGLTSKTKKGSHTTSLARLIPLPFGGWCIDTPGIRSFGLWALTREDLENHFPEIHAIGKECRFPDCTHSHEPDCAVVIAAEENLISPLRLESYIKLLAEV